MNVVLGIAYIGWSLFLLRAGNLYMQSISDASSGAFTFQYLLPLMVALTVAIGATLSAGFNQIFYAASKKVKHFEKYLKALLISFVSHASASFFMIAIDGEDTTVFGYAVIIIGLILICEAITHAVCLRREHREEASKGPKIMNSPLE